MLFNLFTPSYPVVDVNIPEGWWKSDSQLDIDFANNRSFNRKTAYKGRPSELLTYTSPSPKMVFSESGILKYARHNLLPYSEQFDNAAWTPSASSVSSNATIAPNGTTTADKLVEDVSLAYHFVYAAAATVATHSTVSVYLKAGERTWGWLYISSAAEALAYFNLSDGTIGTVSGTLSPSATITNVGGGWYRCSITARISSSVSCGVGVATSNGGISYTGNGSSGIYIWGAQRNLGSVVLDYLDTTSAAKYDLPIDYHPITHAPLGVLVEEQRTNLLKYSQEFDNAAWTKTRSSISANSIAAPDDTMTADKLVEDTTAAASHKLEMSFASSSLTYTFSVHLKAAERTWAALQMVAVSGSPVAYFDLSNGVVGQVGSGLTATIQDAGNGWYRCIVTGVTSATTAAMTVYIAEGDGDATFTGNGTSGIYVWGAQLEAGAFATSYIQTGSAQVTRAADAVNILTSTFEFNANAGVMVVEADTGQMSGSAFSYVWSISDQNSSERLTARTLNTIWGFAVVDGGVTQVSISAGTVAKNIFFKLACGYKLDDFAASFNGGTPVTDVLGSLPTVTHLKLGADANASASLNGHIKRFTYWNTRKSNAELQGLSS